MRFYLYNAEQLRDLFMNDNFDTKMHTVFMCKTNMLETIRVLVSKSDIPLPFKKVPLS